MDLTGLIIEAASLFVYGLGVAVFVLILGGLVWLITQPRF